MEQHFDDSDQKSSESQNTATTDKNQSRHPLKDWRVALLSLGLVGFLPKAPGTWGSVVSVVVVWPLLGIETFSWPLWTSILILGVAISWFMIKSVESDYHVHDPGWIVIDEFLGIVAGWPFLLVGEAADTIKLSLFFILFRLFDMAKPGLIGKIDRNWRGASGTLFDDIAAGLIAGALTAAVCSLPFLS